MGDGFAGKLPARRARAQWLAERPDATVVDVVTHTAGVQAQDAMGARLAIRARSATATEQAVTAAGAGERSVVQTWLMRGTLHLVAAADVRWMLGLFGARNVAGGARRRRELGLDERICTRALAEIPRVLAAESPLSRAQLIDRLVARGVAVNPSGQAPAHLTGYAAAHGLICRGPQLDGGEPGYVLLDEWVPAAPALDPDAALAELARRYLAAYAPAGPADLASWSGLPLGIARRGFAMLAGDLAPAGGQDVVLTTPPPPAGSATPPASAAPASVRLLGPFDTYLLGYRDRTLALPSRYAKRIQAGGGIIHPAVLVDGRVVGRWRLGNWRPGRRSARVEAVVAPFEELDSGLLPALEAEAADLARFLGAPEGELVIDTQPAN